MPSIIIQPTTPYTQYTITNTGATLVNIPFQFLNQADIAVYYTALGTGPDDDSQILTLTTNYTVSFNPDYTGSISLVLNSTYNGGNQTILCAIGDLVTIVDNMSDQRLNYYINTAITANALNTDFESLVLMIKQNTLYNQSIAPHYDLTSNPQSTRDIILPLLGANQCWVMDPTHSFIEAVNFGSGGGGGGGINVNITVIQTAHGFTFGQIVYFNGTSYVLAKADTASDAEVIGIIGTVLTVNSFVLITNGYVTGIPFAVVAGTTYFLSDSSAGALTATEPTTAGHISKPLLIADTTSSGFFNNWRGKVIPSANPVWSVVTSNTQMLTNTGYFANTAGSINLTLPAAANIGDVVEMSNMGSGNFVVAQNAGQQIRIGNQTTTSGVTGSASSAATGDYLRLICNATNTGWISSPPQGNFTIV